MQTYVFSRGEDIVMALDAVSGDPASVTAIRAALKPGAALRATLPPESPATTSFQISSRAAQDDNAPGWTLLVPALQSATLKAGGYTADARLEIGAGVVVTQPIAIRLREPVVPL